MSKTNEERVCGTCKYFEEQGRYQHKFQGKQSDVLTVCNYLGIFRNGSDKGCAKWEANKEKTIKRGKK